MNNDIKIFNLGSINIDHIYRVEHFVQPGETLASTSYDKVLGGKGANQSIALVQALGNHVDQVIHIGALHLHDENMLTIMQQNHVNLTHVTRLESPSGHAIIQVNQQAENAILLFAGANHQVSPEQWQLAFAQKTPGSWALCQNETAGISEFMHAAKAQGLKLAFNPAPCTAAVLDYPLHLLDLLVVNEIEAQQLTATQTISAAQIALAERLPNTHVIITKGTAGAQYQYANTVINVPAYQVNAIDTTAAGDTYIGYFLAHFAQGYDIQKAMQIAAAASALAVTQAGAAPSIPNLNAVHQFIQFQE